MCGLEVVVYFIQGMLLVVPATTVKNRDIIGCYKLVYLKVC